MNLVAYAIQHNHSNLLLDSLLWDNTVVSTRHFEEGRIPFERILDVNRWNEVSEQVGTHILPRLVRYSPTHHPEWDPIKKAFWRIVNHTEPVSSSTNKNNTSRRSTWPVYIIRNWARSRRHDWLPLVQSCTAPFAFGSGKGVGRLWQTNNSIHIHTQHAMLLAMQPAPHLANLVQQVISAAHQPADFHPNNNNHNASSSSMMLVIHPRCEVDMLAHRCSRHMLKNLTTILETILDSPHFSFSKGTRRNSNSTTYFGRIQLLISQTGIEDTQSPMYRRVRALADDNLQTFRHILNHGYRGLPVSTAGEALVRPHVPWEEIQTAGQVLDFFVAVEAPAFVGTSGSSYSRDVWAVRHLQQCRRNQNQDPTKPCMPHAHNYRHSPPGEIHLLKGMPEMHSC